MDYDILKIAGVTKNQKRMRKCRIGEPIQLKRDSKNKFDKNAVQIVSKYGQLGFIPKEEARDYAKAIDHGYKFNATLNEIGEFEDENGKKIAFGTIKVTEKKQKPFIIRLIRKLFRLIIIVTIAVLMLGIITSLFQ